MLCNFLAFSDRFPWTLQQDHTKYRPSGHGRGATRGDNPARAGEVRIGLVKGGKARARVGSGLADPRTHVQCRGSGRVTYPKAGMCRRPTIGHVSVQHLAGSAPFGRGFFPAESGCT